MKSTKHLILCAFLTVRRRDYFWATLALYGSVWLFRILRTWYNSGLFLTAHASALPSGPSGKLVHIRIPVPARVSWRPGQHYFLRCWGLGIPHAFSSHPWTVTSLPGTHSERSLEMVIRVRGGITRALARFAAGRPSTAIAVWVDGPHGGVPGGLDAYDTVLLLGGGSGEYGSPVNLKTGRGMTSFTGSTFVIPLLADLAQRRPNDMQKVQLVLALRGCGACPQHPGSALGSCVST